MHLRGLDLNLLHATLTRFADNLSAFDQPEGPENFLTTGHDVGANPSSCQSLQCCLKLSIP